MKPLVSMFGVVLCVFLIGVSMIQITCTDDDDDDQAEPTSTPTPSLMSISGTVYEGGCNPQVSVRIICAGKETATDQNGHYSLQNVPTGLKTVHAIWDFYGMPLIISKIADAERFDFMFRNVLSITWDYGNITGTVSGMSESYPQDSEVVIQSIGEDGIIMQDYTYQDPANYRLSQVPVGHNVVIAFERDNDTINLTRQTAVDPVNVNEGETTTQDLFLSPDGLETVSGTFSSSYQNYYGIYYSLLNIVSPPFFCYYNQGGEIYAGYGEFYPGNGTYSFPSLPGYCGAEKVTELLLANYDYTQPSIFKLFYNSKKRADDNIAHFTESPEWIYPTSPQPGSSNVGDYPLLAWSGNGARYLLEINGYGDDYLVWQIETTTQEFQVPELADIHLTDYQEVDCNILSKSTWTADLAAITLPLAEETDFLSSQTEFIFYPGDIPNSTHVEHDSLKRLTEQKFRPHVYQKTADGRFLYRLPALFAQEKKGP
ncbi:hypothetical protein JXQ70_15305 [bacterium]|nr:hypothetical protein [bacterium]